ncbi:pancreatic triacylglycerol lipase, partial [Lasius niger]
MSNGVFVFLFLILLSRPPTYHYMLATRDGNSVENETRCYDELGCLNITRSWYHLIHRPLNVFPLPRDVINTRFILYTNQNPLD